MTQNKDTTNLSKAAGKTPTTYSEAGVDVEKADRFVHRLKALASRPDHEKLWKVNSGYAAIYPTGVDSAVACTTDGVGTKLLVAMALNKFDTVGIDLVAMCANDLICVGALPGMFLDYFATGKVDDLQADQIMKGIVEGCDQAGMLLAGGETAEMPDLYQGDHFDLAGFAMGTLSRKTLIDGAGVKAGDAIVAVASSGIHSNGLSLARKVIERNNKFFAQLLVPTRIYCRPAVQIFNEHPGLIKGMAHITGGGWTNIGRIGKSFGYVIDKPLPVPAIFAELAKHVAGEAEMYNTFNMGMGLVIVCDRDRVDTVVKAFDQAFKDSDSGFVCARVGQVQDDFKGIRVQNHNDGGNSLDIAFSNKT